jgi:acetate kinase
MAVVSSSVVSVQSRAYFDSLVKGRVDPIPLNSNLGVLGVGKATLDARMLDEVAVKGRELASEKIAKETESQREQREVCMFIFFLNNPCSTAFQAFVARQEAIKNEISQTLSAFHCDVCDKG